MVRLACVLALATAGCGPNITVVMGDVNWSKSATEERTLNLPHVAGSGVDVRSVFGSIDVAADPSLSEARVVAKVTAHGETEDEAKRRLEEVKVIVTRRDDNVLAVSAEFPKDEKGNRRGGGCSFTVRVPDAKNVTARSENGAVALRGLGGTASATSTFGAVSVKDHQGSVNARSSNGAVTVIQAGCDVSAGSTFGRVAVSDAAGKVKATSNNGAVEVTKAGGPVEAASDFGAVTINSAPGDVTARSGNGAVTVTGGRGAVTARSNFGAVRVEGAGGAVDAASSNGSVSFVAGRDFAAGFKLKSDFGSLAATLPAGAAGVIKASTSFGRVAVTGPGKPSSVTGDNQATTIVLTEKGPESTMHTSNGSVTVTLE
jgi:hypothetical protein